MARTPRVQAPGAQTGQLVTLSPRESRHLLRVLRRRVGDAVVVLAGGHGFHGAIESADGDSSVSVRVGEADGSLRSSLPWRVAVAPVKGSEMDGAIRTASELGVEGIVPLITERGQIPAAASGRTERWRRIATESAKQCGRATPLEVLEAQTIEAVLAGAEGQSRWIAHPGIEGREGGGLSSLRPDPALFLVGPEGGFSTSEVEQAIDLGAQPLAFPTPVLRTPTAVLLVAALGAISLGSAAESG
ncbi:MAG: RsmE family RNA methyltransferase [Planctomycetota bacterium]